MEPEDIRRRIFTAKRGEPEDVRDFNEMYPGYTPANLETHNVLEDGDCCMLVHKDHPVIDLLHQNADILNMDIYLQERVDGKWHRVRKMLFRMACETICKAMGGEPEDVRDFNEMYPGYTPANLETHNVLEDGDCCMLVHKDHPVIDLLHQNADILNMDIYLQERVDGKWHRVRKMLFRMACETICKAMGGHA